MSTVTILVAEDDENIRNGLVDTLESEGYAVHAAADGLEAEKLLGRERFDLVLLDIMMPEKSGYDVCRTLRSTGSDVPVIMLTAKGEEIDKVVGLELGADDYVTKPFGVRELLARIAAVLRRTRAKKKSGAPTGKQSFTFGHAKIDARRFKVKLGRKTFDLSAREVRLLQFFESHPGEVLSRDELLNEVWGIEYYGTTRTLDQHIAQLRKKVERTSDKNQCIQTVHGVGYRYEPMT